MLRYACTVSLCSLVLCSAVASAADIKPRGARSRQDEVIAELTEAGKKLEAKCAEQLSTLKAEIVAALPQIDDADKAALLEAFEAEAAPAAEVRAKVEAVAKWRAVDDKLRNLEEQLKYAPQMVADAKTRLKKALALPDNDEGKAAAIEFAEGKINSRQKAFDALPGQIEEAKEAVRQAEIQLPQAIKEYEAAAKAHARAKARTLKILEGLELGAVIANDKLDDKLAKCMVLSEATPRFLAQFAQQGAEQEKLLKQLFSDTPLMLQMLVADGPFWEKYGPAMEIYTKIRKSSPQARQGVLQRLALAVSLVHAVPMKQRNPQILAEKTEYIDPIARYLSYEKWYLDGELHPTFAYHSVWNLTMVVDGKDPDEVFVWGREMLRNDRPDHIPTDVSTDSYVDVGDSKIMYSSENVKYDKPELHFFQNVLANGGICGRRAFFGRFILRAFGVPTTARKQPGHATLAHWSPDGWKTRLGGKWGGQSGAGRAQMERYGSDLNFLANTQARENEAEFINIKRAQWIGHLIGEQPVYGRIIPDRGKRTPTLGFWHAVALTEQQRIIDTLTADEADAGEPIGGENAEAGVALSEIPEADRKVTVNEAGVITIPAAACSSPTGSTKRLFKGSFREGIVFMKSHLGGMQLHVSRYTMSSDTFEYTFDVPQAGKYRLTAAVVTATPDKQLLVSANGGDDAVLVLPYTVGMWDVTKPIEIKLAKGENSLKFTGPSWVTIREFTLTPAK